MRCPYDRDRAARTRWSRGGRRRRSAAAFGPMPSAPVVEDRRLDVQRTEVHVALPAVMDLIVDDVEDEVVQRVLVLTESRDRLLEPLRRNLRPQGVELLRALIPELEDPVLRPRIAAGRAAPLPGDRATHHW